jgi:hypothetical protein
MQVRLSWDSPGRGQSMGQSTNLDNFRLRPGGRLAV